MTCNVIKYLYSVSSSYLLRSGLYDVNVHDVVMNEYVQSVCKAKLSKPKESPKVGPHIHV